MEKIPTISPELLDWLDQFYPDVMPDFKDGIDAIRFKQGQVDVVRAIKRLYADQQDNILQR